MDKLKLIKSVVFLMTFLLVFGSLAVLGTLFKKSADHGQMPSASSLQEPIGSSIKSITPADNYLYITVSDGGQADRIIIFDILKGQKTSVISVN